MEGIVPVDEKGWRHQNTINFDTFIRINLHNSVEQECLQYILHETEKYKKPKC
jgi:hypothetical protein